MQDISQKFCLSLDDGSTEPNIKIIREHWEVGKYHPIAHYIPLNCRFKIEAPDQDISFDKMTSQLIGFDTDKQPAPEELPILAKSAIVMFFIDRCEKARGLNY